MNQRLVSSRHPDRLVTGQLWFTSGGGGGGGELIDARTLHGTVM